MKTILLITMLSVIVLRPAQVKTLSGTAQRVLAQVDAAGDVVVGAESRAKHRVDCDTAAPGSLQNAIDAIPPGGTILVTGTCHENVTVARDLVTLEGGGEATIDGPDATESTILIRGRGITVKALTVTGGREGIEVSRGGWAVIDGNIIRETGRFGIDVTGAAFAVIVNNAIHDNPNVGIALGMNAAAWIGFVTEADSVASPNSVTQNGAQGIVARRGASVRIVGNDISNNNRNGVLISEAAYAQLSDNSVNGNGVNGILVEDGSGVSLGTTVVGSIFTRRNVTTTNNAGFGVRCQVGGYVQGALGGLNGSSGPQEFSEGCINSLVP